MKVCKYLRTAACLMAALTALPLAAQSDKPEEGKVYLINRNANTSAYIHEASGALLAGAADNAQKQYWRFIPTSTADHYYIQNVTTERYIQSTALPIQNGTSQQVTTGTEPVELEVKANTTSSFTGYYYICSADQTIDTQGDNTLGLNYEASTGKVVAYWIRYNRGNSYWEFHETEYDYQAPEPDVRSDYSRQLGVYNLPCGTTGTAYLTSLKIAGEAIADEVAYTATAAPSACFNLLRNDRATLIPSASANLSYAASGMDGNYKVLAYFDWDADGVFETMQTLGTAATGSLDFSVPDTAKLGNSHIRLRLTDNDLYEVEEGVHGFVYEIMATVAQADAAQRTLTVCSCDTLRGTVSFVDPAGEVANDGKGQVSLTADRGTTVRIEATPNDDAVFKGWVIDGTTVSTESSCEMPMTQSVKVTALFSPNYEVVTGVKPTQATAAAAPADHRAYNLAGQRINPETHRGIYIQHGKKKLK